MTFSSILLTTLLTLLLPPLLFLTWYLHIPRDLPNLPKIPIYVSILGLWSSMGQDEIYERWFRAPLEKHGAVLVWFAGRWSVLVSRPDWLTDMFRNEQIYAKAGSQIKIPHAVIATLVGDNIINAHGENWKLYTSIMKAGLQKKVFDTTSLLKQSRKLVDLLVDLQKETGADRGILIMADVQKWAVDVMGENFLDLDLKSLGQPNGTVRIEALQSIIKATLFKPMYFSFPDLDHFPWLLPSRKRAYNIMHEFDNRLYTMIMTMLHKRTQTQSTQSEEMVSHMLGEAYTSGRITEKQFRDNLKITFLTAHENAQQLVTSMFWQLGTRVDIQDRLREEILATAKIHPNPSQEVINSLPYLTAVVLELLRLFPPVCQLINRVALQPALLGNELPIPKGAFVGWNAWAVHSNPDVWGEDAREFRAERWGDTVEEMQGRFRRETVKGTYIPFNAHKRKCLGQGFALLQVKILLFVLLGRVSWVLDPEYRLKMTPGGILAPLGCRVILTELESSG
ncbi:Cytochrome P450 [Penicillium expansum]|uniref:Cytochrome P450 n=1 Tax=Penicillium expansum TaxID=27334 RepID=A0A0A2JYH7_PENEN|nr:Cytochrome P450 [Penicillium expansum]KGO40444.1 Cytochrome P450 [Penicillium expansum]KGO59668.1 Cytochrome P450 [Penicillium expansum]KGO64696.1 Cytochrome P450 [Penicillium expansum]